MSEMSKMSKMNEQLLAQATEGSKEIERQTASLIERLDAILKGGGKSYGN